MAEYIEREALIKHLTSVYRFYGRKPIGEKDDIIQQTIRRCIGEAKKQPVADVVEVRCGEWKKIELLGCEPMYECSICEKLHDQDYDYCPSCGAKMDGKDGAE